MRPLVIVRPEPGASATAAAAQRAGLSPVVMPLFRIEPVEWRAPGTSQFDGLLLTSANAVRFAGDELGRLSGLPAYCVGESTAAAARNAGLSVALVGDGGIDALLELLPRDLRLLHLCGTDRRQPEAQRQTISAVPVYNAAELPPPSSLSRLAGAVVAVHSPRSAARLGVVAGEAGLRRETIAVAAISGEAAAAAGAGWQSVSAAAEPTDSALLALASSLCNKR
jgi:uroporphyrinogen-III synthase